ncbi:50S ribosomal protein L15 [Rickettsiales endosymbiont of Peranema trichophorum]|uniref:50S ribosomal protein L15 n=1 Tax=Rickettsiales endosymbiont of Peranema trichophorum TaxID=2486577 RepID=UPI001022C890|nr:50S ribosomal protein L15 [Rickettsiales endosymbiont of Peranema trichophorum]RZI45576.1 50S ribosomal protein L15 [Rickettsiales endosymbiont of Peranema trichophorum]
MLNTLRDSVGARKKSKRLGRGIGSGKGKTCARGGKGQTARSGVALGGFEGGQMPLYIRLPKRGFKTNKQAFSVINFDKLELLASKGLIDPSSVTIDDFKRVGVLNGHGTRLKLLATGALKTKFNLEVHASSKKAVEVLEGLGGRLSLIKESERKAETSIL